MNNDNGFNGESQDFESEIESNKAALDRLLAQRRLLDKRIAALRAWIQQAESFAPSEEPGVEYVDLQAGDAVRRLIRISGRPQTEEAILVELPRGGWKPRTIGRENGDIRRALTTSLRCGRLILVSKNPPTYDLPDHEKSKGAHRSSGVESLRHTERSSE